MTGASRGFVGRRGDRPSAGSASLAVDGTSTTPVGDDGHRWSSKLFVTVGRRHLCSASGCLISQQDRADWPVGRHNAPPVYDFDNMTQAGDVECV